MELGLAVFLSVAWVSSLGFAAFLVWVLKFSKLPEKEIKALRAEMTALAMAVGLQKNRMHVGPVPPMMGGNG